MNITRGKIPSARKVCLYGVEGIGKSTFASKFPDPLFIDTEGGTKELDVARLDKPTSWAMLMQEVQYVASNPECCKTLVIDTIDWTEQLCIDHICSKHKKDGLESFAYGSGYIYEKEEFGRFLSQLEAVILAGIHVVLLAHAQIRKFEQPDENGAYDRWELKLGKKSSSQISPMVKEWADMVLFANYKTTVVNVDNRGAAKGKNKAQGGMRVMYTTHHPCWDAKNRFGLPDEMPFDFASIAHVVGDTRSGAVKPEARAPEQAGEAEPAQPTPTQNAPTQNVPAQPAPAQPESAQTPSPASEGDTAQAWRSGVPEALLQLMDSAGVTEGELKQAVAAAGFYPEETPIARYDVEFVRGVLVADWSNVFAMVQSIRDTPF